jgi:DEAD/DEAH box helicase domain-containing protein
MQMHTTAFWLTIPETACVAVKAGRAAAVDGLRGLGVALKTVCTLALMCDPRDLGTALGGVPLGDGGLPILRETSPARKDGYDPTLFLYEHVPGGTGLAERIWEQRDVLVAAALRLIEGCKCAAGCPACVSPGEPWRKSTALELLRLAVGELAVGQLAEVWPPAVNASPFVVCATGPEASSAAVSTSGTGRPNSLSHSARVHAGPTSK